jgi:hypothetical protein
MIRILLNILKRKTDQIPNAWFIAVNPDGNSTISLENDFVVDMRFVIIAAKNINQINYPLVKKILAIIYFDHAAEEKFNDKKEK